MITLDQQAKAFEYFALSESLLQNAKPAPDQPGMVEVGEVELVALLSLAESDAHELPAILKPQAS